VRSKSIKSSFLVIVNSKLVSLMLMLDPETEAISLTSAAGRSSRENHDPAVWGVVGKASAAKSSTCGSKGYAFARRPGNQRRPKSAHGPAGRAVGCVGRLIEQDDLARREPIAQIGGTTTPAGSLVVLVNGAGPTRISGDGSMFNPGWGNGLAPLVFSSVVRSGPAPRKVIPLLISTK
jgi:hypothetical protein